MIKSIVFVLILNLVSCQQIQKLLNLRYIGFRPRDQKTISHLTNNQKLMLGVFQNSYIFSNVPDGYNCMLNFTEIIDQSYYSIMNLTTAKQQNMTMSQVGHHLVNLCNALARGAETCYPASIDMLEFVRDYGIYMGTKDNLLNQLRTVYNQKTEFLLDIANAFRQLQRADNYYETGKEIGDAFARFVPQKFKGG